MLNIRETAWNHYAGTGQPETHGTFCSSEYKWVNRIKKLAAAYPDQVDIRAENEDGSICAHIPIGWFRIAPPRNSNYTDEQRKAIGARLQQARELVE